MLRSAWELIRASHGKENDGKDRLDVFGSTGLGVLLYLTAICCSSVRPLNDCCLSGLWALSKLGMFDMMAKPERLLTRFGIEIMGEADRGLDGERARCKYSHRFAALT